MYRALWLGARVTRAAAVFALLLPACSTGDPTSDAADDSAARLVSLYRTVHFDTTESGRTALTPGAYLVESKGDSLVLEAADGTRHTLSARSVEHDEKVERTVAVTVPWGKDCLDAVLLRPDGTSTVASGCYSAVTTRGGASPPWTRKSGRAKRAYAAARHQQTIAKAKTTLTLKTKPSGHGFSVTNKPPKPRKPRHSLEVKPNTTVTVQDPLSNPAQLNAAATKVYTYTGVEAVTLARRHQYMFVALAQTKSATRGYRPSGFPQDGIFSEVQDGQVTVARINSQAMTTLGKLGVDYDPYFVMFYARALHENPGGRLYESLEDYGYEERALPPGWSVEAIDLRGEFKWIKKPQPGSTSLTFVIQMNQRGSSTTNMTAVIHEIKLRGPANAKPENAFQLPKRTASGPAPDDGTEVYTVEGIDFAQALRTHGYKCSIFFPNRFRNANPESTWDGTVTPRVVPHDPVQGYRRAGGFQDGLAQEVRALIQHVPGQSGWQSPSEIMPLWATLANGTALTTVRWVDTLANADFFLYFALYYSSAEAQANHPNPEWHNNRWVIRGRPLPAGWSFEDVKVTGEFAWVRKPRRGDKELAMILRMSQPHGGAGNTRTVTVDWIKLRGPANRDWTEAIQLD